MGDGARHRVLKNLCVRVCVWVYVYVCTEANFNENSNKSGYSNTTANWKVTEDETRERHIGRTLFLHCASSSPVFLPSSPLVEG